MDNAAKEIVERIRDYNIKKLVMGAAANKHFFRVKNNLSLVETGKSHLSDPSSSSSYLTCSGKATSNSDQSASETPGDNPAWLELHILFYSGKEGSSDDDNLFDKLEQSLVNAEKSNQEALDELDRRMKADKDALKAVLRQVSEMKSSYVGEFRRRKETEATLRKQNKDPEQNKKQRYEARNIGRTQKLLLDNQGANSGRVKVLEAKVSSAAEQLKVRERERDDLQIKLENACKLIEDHSTKQEEDTSSVHMQQFFSEFSVAEIHDANEDFDPSFKIAEGAYINVDILSKVRHPNLVTLIGVCPEIWALIYEYLPNGSLEDRLSRKDNTTPLSWQTRIHIATEICAALIFLHSICRALSSLENSSDTTDISRRFPYLDPQFCSTRTLTPSSDIYPFGLILLQLITGKPPVLLAEEVQYAVNGQYLNDLLDPSAGGWPYVQAEQLTRWALRCCDPNRSCRPDLASEVYKMLEQIRNDIGPLTTFHAGSDEHNQPSHYFICSISQKVMAEQYVAADGYTYKLQDLRRWLDSGHNTSHVIGNQLAHRTLNPNYAIRSAILEGGSSSVNQTLYKC
ncbi:putative U-box domain-containing protein kinase family protein [Hibiscus syriacus]|uniref:RING-type E3 ubiquitin transferase n=1 Tax=Hibiscus syriacus TaxID=106335 RepID=A0A6A3D1P0_HIBSY|nr:putative U-box domain-containing protein kinase family protein [Hibiscus syriacus]